MTILLPTLQNMLLPVLCRRGRRRWLDVGEAEYRRRMRARSGGGGGDGGGCVGIIALFIILWLLSEC